MYTTVSESDFHDAFENLRPNNFSYEGRKVLFEYLEEYEEDTTLGIELDVIALCCEYTEDLNKNHLSNYSISSMRELENHTTVIKEDEETSIIQDF